MQQRPAVGVATPAKESAADLLRAVRGREKPTGPSDLPPPPRLTTSILRAGTRMRLLSDGSRSEGLVLILRHERGKTRLPVTEGVVDLPEELPHARAELWLARDGYVSGPVNVRIVGRTDAYV